jgi:hypothetical protein
VKEGIASLDEIERQLEINGEHRNHILHAGTDIIQFTPSDDIEADLP